MSYLNFTHNNKRYHLNTVGVGDRVVFVLPGFGQSVDVLNQLTIEQEYQYVVLTPDTTDSVDPSKDDLVEVVKMYLAANGISEFDIVGFSIGSKPALVIWQFFESQIQNVTLLAPESVNENVLYKFAVRTSLGRWLFKLFVSAPLLLSIPLFFIGKRRRKLFQRVWSEQRGLIYNTWMTYARWGLSSIKIRQLLKSKKAAVYLASKEELPINKGIEKACLKAGIQVEYVDVKHHRLLDWFIQVT